VTPRAPVELPLWGNLIVLAVVLVLLGFIVRDIIAVCRNCK
jgi:hypothetical protein